MLKIKTWKWVSMEPVILVIQRIKVFLYYYVISESRFPKSTNLFTMEPHNCLIYHVFFPTSVIDI